MAATGLVLGAGGSTGLAFEVGVLLALAVDHRIEPREAAAIVGTSAGSIVGALLDRGASPADLAAIAVQAPLHISPGMLDLAPANLSPVTRLPTPREMIRFPGVSGLVRSIGHLAAGRLVASFMVYLRDGAVDLRPWLSFLGSAWPESSHLSVCTAHQSTGRRLVLQSGRAPLSDAVAASCAVPGVMSPVVVDGMVLVDGGVHSPTNADLLTGASGPETLVIVSPMTGDRSTTLVGQHSSLLARLRLRQELRRLGPGQQAFVIEPTGALSAAVVDEALTCEDLPGVLSLTFVSTSSGG